MLFGKIGVVLNIKDIDLDILKEIMKIFEVNKKEI